MQDPDHQKRASPVIPFDNIEGSHQYVSLLAEAIKEAHGEVDEELALAMQEGAERRKEALQIVAYTLAKLELHIKTSSRLLNDLRTMRRLLLAERDSSSKPATEADFNIRFAPDVSPDQVRRVLTALADYYRACGGVGLRIIPEMEEVLVNSPEVVNA